MEKPRDADLWVRNLIRAASDDLGSYLEVAKLDPDLIATLYIRLREALDSWDGASEGDLVERATLTVYLTAAAWAPAGERGPVLLDSLRARIARTVVAGPQESDLQLQNASRKKGAET